MIRCFASVLISFCCLTVAAKECPAGFARQITIGGDVSEGFVLRNAYTPRVKAVPSAAITVYSSAGKKVYANVTDKDGKFGAGVLPPDEYRIVVDGFGSYKVKLDPKVGDTGGPDRPFFTLWLADNGCASFIANGN